jgi:hypothetical protein
VLEWLSEKFVGDSKLTGNFETIPDMSPVQLNVA